MTINRRCLTFAQLAIVAVFALTLTAPLHAQVNEYAAVSLSDIQSTSSLTLVPIAGLTITLPAAGTNSKCGYKCATENALVFLDLPNLYLTGTTTTGTQGALVSLWVGAGGCAAPSVEVAIGQISDDTLTKGTSGRKPMTIIVNVPLDGGTQVVTACWESVRASGAVNIGGFASLSAINMNLTTLAP
jgi:hypothetical protein